MSSGLSPNERSAVITPGMADMGIEISEAEMLSEDSLADIVGNVEIRVGDQVTASSKLAYADISPDNTHLILPHEGDIEGRPLPLSKYAPGNGAQLIVARNTVGTFPGSTKAAFYSNGEVALMMQTASAGLMPSAILQGELLNLTDEDVANLRKDDTLIDRYLATGEGLESPNVCFYPYRLRLLMTPGMDKLCKVVGPPYMRTTAQDSDGEAKQNIFFVHREHRVMETYALDLGKATMKQLFACFLDKIRPMDEKATLKSMRFTHNGKVLFPSSVGKQTPHALGINAGDKIFVSTIERAPKEAPPPVERRTTKKPKRKGSKKGKIKSRKRTTTPAYGGAEEQEKVQLQRLYSDVKEEAETKHFRSIRQRLNAMNLERTEPKVKTVSQKQATTVVTPPSSPSDGHEDKAMKSRFVIHVGEVQNLYKSTKPSKRFKSRLARGKALTVDLHAMSKEEALDKLDNELPQWINVAMRGDHPFVIPVVIICGKGSQVLSEAVEQWIGQNEKVANAPKNLQL